MPVLMYTKEEVDALIASLPSGGGGSSYRVPASFDFYRNSAVPLQSANSTAWAFPGSALSASLHLLYASMGLSLRYARFLVAWTPGGGGVRLVHMDSGPTNITEIAKFEQAGSTPVVSAFDVTGDLQGLLAGGTDKMLGLQMHGSGYGSAKVYSACIETVWN